MTLSTAATILRRLAAVLVIAVLWVGVSHFSQSIYFPSLAKVLSAFTNHWFGAGFKADLLPSLKRMFAGFLLGGVTGIAVGLALGAVRPLRKMVEPPLHFARSIPGPVLVLVLLVLFGIGDKGKIVAIALAGFFPVVLNTMAGYSALEQGLRDVSTSFGLSKRQWFVFGLLPSVAPQAAAGLRTSLALSFIVMIVSEYIGATNGIGYFVNTSAASFDFPQMWGGVLLLSIIGVCSNLVFLAIERRVIFWTSTGLERER